MTPRQLDNRAYHVYFEVFMLVEQIEFYIDNYAPTFPSTCALARCYPPCYPRPICRSVRVQAGPFE